MRPGSDSQSVFAEGARHLDCREQILNFMKPQEVNHECQTHNADHLSGGIGSGCGSLRTFADSHRYTGTHRHTHSHVNFDKHAYSDSNADTHSNIHSDDDADIHSHHDAHTH